uniref:J domain-containing protein n=1 Tax=Meloidogyne incognita TaxID=6306 RepID=A0A914LJH4_MELIC
MHFNLFSLFLLIFLVIVESIPDHYRTLGVPKNASTEEIRTAHKKLMLKYHPDKTKNDPIALGFSQEINNAKDILTDEKKRRDHDKKLQEYFGSSYTTSEGASTFERTEKTAGSSATPRESSRASDGAFTTHGGAPTSGRSFTMPGGASTMHGETSTSYQGAYRSSSETSSDESQVGYVVFVYVVFRRKPKTLCYSIGDR